MKKILSLAVAVIILAVAQVNAQNNVDEGKIIFCDNFDQTSSIPDTAVWKLCTYAHNAWSQHFKHVEGYENVIVKDGKLILKVTKEDGYYKNGGIRTRFGFPCNTRVTARVGFNHLVKGGFPAVWQMPVGGREWPRSGEVDIMEWVQGTPDAVYQTIHTLYNQQHRSDKETGETNITHGIDILEFHEYAADRTPEAIIFYIDGVETGRYENMHNDEESLQFPFCSHPFDIILNYSLGGEINGHLTWPGAIDDNDLPGEMIVDWVKVTEL